MIRIIAGLRPLPSDVHLWEGCVISVQEAVTNEMWASVYLQAVADFSVQPEGDERQSQQQLKRHPFLSHSGGSHVGSLL